MIILGWCLFSKPTYRSPFYPQFPSRWAHAPASPEPLQLPLVTFSLQWILEFFCLLFKMIFLNTRIRLCLLRRCLVPKAWSFPLELLFESPLLCTACTHRLGVISSVSGSVSSISSVTLWSVSEILDWNPLKIVSISYSSPGTPSSLVLGVLTFSHVFPDHSPIFPIISCLST